MLGEPVLKQYQSLKYGLNFLYPAEWGNQSDRCSLFCGPTFLITSNGTISQPPDNVKTMRLLDIHVARIVAQEAEE